MLLERYRIVKSSVFKYYTIKKEVLLGISLNKIQMNSITKLFCKRVEGRVSL